MRYVPKLNVRNRLTLAFFLVIVLSFLLNMWTVRYIIEQDHRQFRRELAARIAADPDRAQNGGSGAAPSARTRPGDNRSGDNRSGGNQSGDVRPGDNRPGDVRSGGNRPGGDRPGGDRPGGPRRRPRWRDPWPRAFPVLVASAFIMSLAAGAWISRRITRPLLQLEEGAHAFHEREFQHRIPERGDDEFARVASSMNEMAQRVEGQFNALEADARRRKQLLADVAHELRSPVATLKTMAEAMRDGVASQPERRERALNSMIGMADRLQRLVNDLMELTKLDLRELPLHLKTVDLADIAEESIALHLDEGATAGVTLHPVGSEGDTRVYGDPLRLSEMIDNLLNNAIDHAGSGAAVTVRVRGGESVTLTVEDTGRGIPADQLPYVFDPFYRVDSARTPGDHHSGLGLRIARGLAEAHDGTLVLESEEGKGTRAILTLPTAPTAPSAPAAPEQPRTSAASMMKV